MFLESIIGGGVQAGLGALNNYWSERLQSQARLENYKYGEMAAENADRRTRALYNDYYSPAALLKQYQEAGLSPSLMFGGTPGQGGMSGAQGTGANGPGALYTPISMVEGAQAAALMAQAEKTKAETKVVEETAHASIEEMLANAGHAKAAAAVAEAQATGQNLHNYFTSQTMEGSIYKLCAEAEEAGYRAEKAYHEMRSAKVLGDINEETYQEQVQAKRKEVELLAQKITESKSVVKLNEQERRKVYNDILGMWDDLDRRWKEQETNKQQADTYTDWINAQIPTIEKQLEIRF